MEIKLLTDHYKNDENFYQAFLEDTLWQSDYLSNESVLIPRTLPSFPIYLNQSRNESAYFEMFRVMTEYVLELDRDITMSERFWHSWLCLYQRDYLLDKYPKIKVDYSAFKTLLRPVSSMISMILIRNCPFLKISYLMM